MGGSWFGSGFRDIRCPMSDIRHLGSEFWELPPLLRPTRPDHLPRRHRGRSLDEPPQASADRAKATIGIFSAMAWRDESEPSWETSITAMSFAAVFGYLAS